MHQKPVVLCRKHRITQRSWVVTVWHGPYSLWGLKHSEINNTLAAWWFKYKWKFMGPLLNSLNQNLRRKLWEHRNTGLEFNIHPKWLDRPQVTGYIIQIEGCSSSRKVLCLLEIKPHIIYFRISFKCMFFSFKYMMQLSRDFLVVTVCIIKIIQI